MNKIKIIDLLKKIAKGEEVPKIRYGNFIYKYNKNNKWFDDIDRDDWCKSHFSFCELNDEVEIIEEEKEIEKFDTNKFHDIDELVYKINELIDVVNELKRQNNE